MTSGGWQAHSWDYQGQENQVLAGVPTSLGKSSMPGPRESVAISRSRVPGLLYLGSSVYLAGSLSFWDISSARLSSITGF